MIADRERLTAFMLLRGSSMKAVQFVELHAAETLLFLRWAAWLFSGAWRSFCVVWFVVRLILNTVGRA